jgi:peptide deformylase
MIIVNNEEALKIRCENAIPDEVGSIVEKLEQELEYSIRMGRPGIGLAAPQIGIAKNVAIVRLDNNYKVNLVNCNIKDKYDLEIFRDEGCLSFPGRIENTMRYQEVHIVDNLVYPKSFIVSGLMAVVVQHELDHLNGILLPDIALQKPKKKVGPNDPCVCGSKIKFKKCCGKRDI